MTVEEALLAVVGAIALVLLFLGLADALEGDPRTWLRGRRRRLARPDQSRHAAPPAPPLPPAPPATAPPPPSPRPEPQAPAPIAAARPARTGTPAPEPARATPAEGTRAP